MKIRKSIQRDAKRLLGLCLSEGVLDAERVRRVITLITASEQRERFALLTQFRRLVHLQVVSHTAVIESAAPLSADLQASVQSDLAQTYGPGLDISFAESPGLIGGMRIQVGSDVYDASVQARLAALKANF